MSGEPGVAVVHLVRQANGMEPLERFLDSHRRNPPGAEHRLVLLLKGFADPAERERAAGLAADLSPLCIDLPDDGFDLGAYRRAALRLTSDRLVFLNSFSIIRHEGWLAAMLTAAAGKGVGLVGTSGSWGSRSSHARYSVGLGGPYVPIFDDPETTHQVFLGLTPPQQKPGEEHRPPGRARIALGVAREVLSFPGFPAAHLRTNGLLVERELWLELCPRVPSDKRAAYAIESGRRGITALARRRGLRALLVAADGSSYEPEGWYLSRTFWQGDQGNLLIADNQTLSYERGNITTRSVLSRYAWGTKAEPLEVP